MVFNRTPIGILNYPLFHKGKKMVFLEGGNCSFTKGEVLNGTHNESSYDLLFWGPLFKKFKRNLNAYEFRPVGNKQSLFDIAKTVANKDKNIIVLMDRDYDCFCGNIISGKNILYTYGYSFENDILKLPVLTGLYDSLCSIQYGKHEASKKLKQGLNHFKKEITCVLKLDITTYINSGEHIIPKNGKNIRKYIIPKKESEPALKINDLEKLFTSYYKQTKQQVVKIKPKRQFKLNVLKDCPGHIMDEYFYYYFIFVLRALGKKKANYQKELFKCNLISQFISLINQNELPQIKNYYKEIISKC